MSHAAPMRASDRPEPAPPIARPLVIDQLWHAAERQPEVVVRAGRDLTHAEAWARTGAIASWLIAQGFGPHGAPVAILSDHSLESALFLFGAWRAGVRVAPLSSDLCRSGDFADLDQALDALAPGLVFARDSAACGAALDRAGARGARIVTGDGRRGLALAALAACSIDAAVAERRGHITADTVAEISFTGPTGRPTGVPRSHGDLARSGDLQSIFGGGSG